MKGQWIGNYQGTTSGLIILNVDELGMCYEGMAYIHPNDAKLPKAEAHFRTVNKSNPATFKTNLLQPIDPDTGVPAPWERIKDRFPSDTRFAQYADVTARYTSDMVDLEWATDIGTKGGGVLPRSRATDPSELVADKLTWAEFKKQAIEFGRKEYLLRGQSKPWRLRTAFHRHGRSNLAKFLGQDIPLLHKHLSARTRHFFNLQNLLENAAFLSLAQHHGYPTNLLDWTRSPYVAAFFAYRTVTKDDLSKATEDARARVYIFDGAAWARLMRQVHSVVSPMLHVSFLDVLAIENERLIPQQGISLMSSIDDIEGYIRKCENELNRTLLRAIDLPVMDRDNVMEELRFMGITAGSLFPGLDGACEELKERNFR